MNKILQLAVCILLLAVAANTYAASVILNEYNAVSDTKTLKSGGSDSYFGQVAGNGGDWFELVAVENVDMRGWYFYWANDDSTEGEGYIYLSDDDFWSDIKAGTIITVCQSRAVNGGKDTDTTFDPNTTGDWWVNICTEEEQTKYNQSQVWLARVEPSSDTGHFKVDNDDWYITIYDDDDDVVFGPTGEFNCIKGISSTEVYYLYNDPSTSITAENGIYDDGANSTFGAPNIADNSGDAEEADIVDERVQEFSWWGDPMTCQQAHDRGFYLEGDINDDCRVNLVDFAIVAQEWAKCFDPENELCDHPWDN